MSKPFMYSSLFGELTKSIQARIDAASELNKRLFDNVLYRNYLDWDSKGVSLDFEELRGKHNLTIAAATIGDNSKEPVLGSYGVETMRERVLNQAVTLPMTVQDYRKITMLLDSKTISDQQKNAQLIDLMWGDVQRVVNGVEAKLDLIFLSALSSEGKFTFDEKNNPEGGVRGEINYQQPAGNIASSKTAWADANVATVDCFEDIQAILDAADSKSVLGKILCSPSRISYMCRTKKMKQMIHGSDKSSQIVQLKDINDYMTANGLPTFVPIRRQMKIQNGSQLTAVTPWNDANMVFVPDGKLGVVKSALSNCELKPESDVAYSNYGNIVVSKWYVGETKGANYGEFTKAEVLALPVITEIENIYTLKTYTA